MPDLPHSPYLGLPRRSEAAVKAEKIAVLKREFFRLMREHRQRKYGAPASCSDRQIAEQIAHQNVPLRAAADIAVQVDDLLGEQWDYLAEEANRGEDDAQANVADLERDVRSRSWDGLESEQ